MKDNGPRHERRHDDLGDRLPNDWLEAAILFIAGCGVFGGFFALIYLAKLNGAM